jgi:DNA repair protein RecO (recombination protein O)
MSVLVTDAIVLHAFDYLESSRIIRLLTRDAGVRSVLARGARSSRRRFGAALDLYAQGSAELHTKPGRDLDTLGAFDVTRSRASLGAGLERFAGAGAIAELALRFGHESADAGLFDAVATALDELAIAASDRARDLTLAAGWRILLELGVAPTIDACAECHASLEVDAPAAFSHPAGGVLCARCAHLARGGRTLPGDARNALRDWLAGTPHAILDPQTLRAHQRLLREFVREHLADDRPLRAFDAWEHDTLSRGAPTAEFSA